MIIFSKKRMKKMQVEGRIRSKLKGENFILGTMIRITHFIHNVFIDIKYSQGRDLCPRV